MAKFQGVAFTPHLSFTEEERECKKKRLYQKMI